MTLNQYFDRTFVINLWRRPDRWEQSCNEVIASGLVNVSRFDGVDHPTSGNAGCTQSHRMLLREIASGPWARVLVLEDDFAPITLDVLKANGFIPEYDVWKIFCSVLGGGGTLNERFDRLSQFLPKEWDVLYLGAGYGEPPISRLNKHVIRCGFMQTTSSYGITREFAKTWSATVDDQYGPDIDSCGETAIDNIFGSMSKDRLFYVTQPRLFFQRMSKSDLTGNTSSYLCSMTDPVHELMCN